MHWLRVCLSRLIVAQRRFAIGLVDCALATGPDVFFDPLAEPMDSYVAKVAAHAVLAEVMFCVVSLSKDRWD